MAYNNHYLVVRLSSVSSLTVTTTKFLIYCLLLGLIRSKTIDCNYEATRNITTTATTTYANTTTTTTTTNNNNNNNNNKDTNNIISQSDLNRASIKLNSSTTSSTFAQSLSAHQQLADIKQSLNKDRNQFIDITTANYSWFKPIKPSILPTNNIHLPNNQSQQIKKSSLASNDPRKPRNRIEKLTKEQQNNWKGIKQSSHSSNTTKATASPSGGSVVVSLSGNSSYFRHHPGPPSWINLGLGKYALMEVDDVGHSEAKGAMNRLRSKEPYKSSSAIISSNRDRRNNKLTAISLKQQQQQSLDKQFDVAPLEANKQINQLDHLLIYGSEPTDDQSTGLSSSLERGLQIQEQLRQVPCDRMTGLTKGQSQLCHLYKDHMPFIGLGAKMTIDECQYQFRNNKWNCSILDSQSVFGPIIKTGVKETAFLNALASASVVYTIARACRDGQLSNCGCSTAPKPKSVKSSWTWGGCGDNINYAYRFSEEFVDLKERELLPLEKYQKEDSLAPSTSSSSSSDLKLTKAKLDRKRLMNIHNNRAGRRAAIRKTKITCKCHGVSGSCSLVTCWQQLASFRDIGDFLKERYDSAAEVKFAKHEGKLQVRNKRQNGQERAPTVDDLIYIEQSPNYCNKIDKLGFSGTSGRRCNSTRGSMEVPSLSSLASLKSSSSLNGSSKIKLLDTAGADDNVGNDGDDSCQRLCCSRGFKTIRVIKSYRCNCKFKYCCKMECQTCYQARMESVCN